MPDGILLVTGPTGSGKTTTLYSCLHFINRPDRKIITVEDPVEYILAGINQVQVNEAVGLTFAMALRSILRQAPNIVMIGEIRDLETATIAINASLTGHLVFSTLHTNDAPERGHASRGHRREAVSGGLLHALPHGPAAGAQNLQKMRAAVSADGRGNARLEPHPGRCEERRRSRKAAAATIATNTGNRGRFGIFEIFVIDDEARKLIYDQVPRLGAARARAGNGHAHLARGRHPQGARRLTTPEEVIRTTRRRRSITPEIFMSYSMSDLLQLVVAEGASDLHIRVGAPPTIRVHGILHRVEGPALKPEDTEELMRSITSEEHIQSTRERGGADFGFAFGDAARFRVSVFKEKGQFRHGAPADSQQDADVGADRPSAESAKELLYQTARSGPGHRPDRFAARPPRSPR